MFVSEGQFYYFSECFLIGALCGLCCLPIMFLQTFIRNKPVKALTDLAAIVPLFLIYRRLSLFFGFPDFRIYMIAGVICGFMAESASFNKTLAFFGILLYNKIGGELRRKIAALRRKYVGRRQIKKARRGGNRNGSDSIVCADGRNGLSARFHGDKKERSRKTARGNNGA